MLSDPSTKALRSLFLVALVCAEPSLIPIALSAPTAVSSTTIDTELLVGRDRPIRLEVAYHPRCKPIAESLDRFRAVVHEILPDKEVDVVVDSLIPEASWPKTITDIALDRLVQEWIGEAALSRVSPQDTVYVLYLPKGPPDERSVGGKRRDWVVEREGALHYVPGLWLSCEALDNGFTPFVSRPLLEAFVLSHEFGHVLGLVNSAQRRGNAIPFHCSNKHCLMTTTYDWSMLRIIGSGLPGMRLPFQLCRVCRAELVAAQKLAKSESSRGELGGRRLREFEAKASFLSRHQRWLEAREILLEATTQFPADDALLLRASEAVAMTGDFKEGAKLVQRAVARAPIGTEETVALGRQLCRLGSYRDVLRFVPAERVGNDMSLAWLRSWGLEGVGDLDAAINELKAFVSRRVSREGKYWAYEQLARLSRLAGRLAEAARFHDKSPWRVSAERPYDQQLELVKLDFAMRRSEAALSRLSAMRGALERGLDNGLLDPWVRLRGTTKLAEVTALLGDKDGVARLVAKAEELEAADSEEDPIWRLRIARALTLTEGAHASVRWLLSMTGRSLPGEPMADLCLDSELTAARHLIEASPAFSRCAPPSETARSPE